MRGGVNYDRFTLFEIVCESFKSNAYYYDNTA